MDSRPFTVQQIYQDRRQYRVPFYQRPYVWNKEDQWGRLWEDIQDKADIRLEGGKVVPHFMGAVVLEPQKKVGLLGVERHHIIDGQQRLTTMQYVLNALAFALRHWDQPKFLSIVESCLYNTNHETMEDSEIEQFKLWPTFRDRNQYIAAMTAKSVAQLRDRFPASFKKDENALKKIGVDHPPALEAIIFFYEAMVAWADKKHKESSIGFAILADALISAIMSDLSIICISLGEEDDAQVIFETLNGHGAELHATDLIRNFIFMRANTNADDLYTSLWSQFEAPLWSEPQSRGRLNRPRMEWFVQTAVQAETGEEIDIGRLYAGYRRFVGARSADAQLELLNRHAENYRALVMGSGSLAIGIFGRRIRMWDASACHALALRIASSHLTQDEQREIFDCIESYFVRRAICGLTRKNYNKVFAQQLKKLQDQELTPASFKKALAEPTGDASRWPRDEEFNMNWVCGDCYPGRLDAAKVRTIFHRLETEMRSEKSEEQVPLEMDNLDIDHIFPQSWYAEWCTASGLSCTAEEAAQLKLHQSASDDWTSDLQEILDHELSIPRMGNLTLVHYGVNRSVQNKVFEKKRQALFAHSHLQLNRELMLAGPIWDSACINERGQSLFQFARNIWKGPI